MTQYTEEVEMVRLREKASKWAKTVRAIHGHSMDSMWYDDRPEDTADGKTVVDIEYNDGTVKREFADGTSIIMGTPNKGEDLLASYQRHN
jgi:hypothetical protein